MIRHRMKVLAARRAPSLVLAALALVAGSLGPAVTPADAQTPQQQPQQQQDNGTNGSNSNCPAGSNQTAAAALGYTNPAFSDDFNEFDESKWMAYSGPSQHQYGQFDAQGGGRRTREQISTADGVMTITGLPNGDTGGMSTERSHRQRYGLWEARVKLPTNATDYHSVLILMAGGAELDFMENMDPAGRRVNAFMHMPGGEERREVTLQDNEWHNWAIEWRADRIRLYRDGQQWGEDIDASSIPAAEGVMTIQLDWFPQDQGETGTAEFQVDWVRIYGQGTQAPNGGTTTNVNQTNTNTNTNTNGCAAPCANGYNSLGQCQQNPNGNNGSNGTNPAGCRWYKHPQQDFAQQFTSASASQGSVLLFYGCYDPQSGLVTAAPSAPEAGNSVGPVPVRMSRPGERACNLSETTTQQVNQQTNDQQNQQTNDQQNQQQDNQQQDNRQQQDQQNNNRQQQDDQQQEDGTQNCYYELPQNARFHPTVAIGLLLTNAQVQVTQAPELLATPPVGQPSIINQPTFVCVTNFPSGTNFPGAASVPENRRRGAGNDQGGNGRNGQPPSSSSSTSSTTTTAPLSAPQQAAGSHDGSHDQHTGTQAIRGWAGQEGNGQQDQQGNRNQDQQPNNDQQTGNDQQQPNDNGQQASNQGNGSFSPGVVRGLTPAQQACLQAQTGRGGAAATGNGSGQGSGSQQTRDTRGSGSAGNRDQQGDGQGSGNGGSGNGGSGNGTGGQGQGSSGGNLPVNGLCAPTAQAPTGPTGPTGQDGQAAPIEGTVQPGTADPNQPTDPNGSQTPDGQGQIPPSQPVTDQQSGNSVGACVRVQLYPTIRWDPGDGTGAFECVAPGTVYQQGSQRSQPQQSQQGQQQDEQDQQQQQGQQPDQQQQDEQGQQPDQNQQDQQQQDEDRQRDQQQQQQQPPGQGGSTGQYDNTECVHAYSKASNIRDPQSGEQRPQKWPGTVSVVWRADWDACLVHAPGGSTEYSAGAGHEANYVDSTGMNFDFASLGEGGQAPSTGDTGEVSNGTAYAGTYNLGLNDDGVQSAVAPLPRQVDEVSGVNADQGND